MKIDRLLAILSVLIYLLLDTVGAQAAMVDAYGGSAMAAQQAILGGASVVEVPLVEVAQEAAEAEEFVLPSYVRLLSENEDVEQIVLPDSVFNTIAGRTIFKVNRTELNTRDPFVIELTRRILPYANEKGWMLVGIDLRGAASPEGPYNNNVRLSVGRAAALRRFMSQGLDSVQLHDIETTTVAEDYPYVLWLLEQDNDPAAPVLRGFIEECGMNNPAAIKRKLQQHDRGRTWRRLLRDYFPTVRAARVVLYFREINPHHPEPEPTEPRVPFAVTPFNLPDLPMPKMFVNDIVRFNFIRMVERPHMLSIGTNVLYDGFYMPNFGWAPMPNLSLEFFPLTGNWTYRVAFMWPYYHRWSKHKFFQIRDYHLEARRYFNPGFLHTGAYLAGYINTTIYGIGFSATKGWEGEGLGGALKVGYVLPLGSGRWRLDFHAAFGAWYTRYDPYIWGNPLTGEYDGKYYYEWYGRKSDFRRRNHQLFWFGPSEIGVTLSYDILYYRKTKPGVSVLRYEPYPQIP